MKNIFRLNIIIGLFPLFASPQVNVKEDTLKLPFAIAKEKQLSEEDLASKKEGMYVTGVPDISSDPVNGFGLGVEGR